MKFTITFQTGSDLSRFNAFRNEAEDKGARIFAKHVDEDALTFSGEVLSDAQAAKLFKALVLAQVPFSFVVA